VPAFVTSWLDKTLFFGNSVAAWLWAGGFALGTFLLLLIVRRLAISRLEKVASRTATDLDDFALILARRTLPLLLLLPSLHVGGALRLRLSPGAATALKDLTVLTVLVQVGLWSSTGVAFWVARTRRRQQEGGPPSFALIGALGFLAKAVLWAVLVLVALANLGVDVTALAAGLGIGGVAVALALQNVLGDVFAALSIVLDRPFVLGDVIAVDDLQGTVESIGMKTTRVRSINGEQLIFANSDLLKSRVRNLRRSTERRIVVAFSVSAGTPVEQLEKIPRLAQAVMEEQPGVRFDRAHFKAIGPSSFDFEAACFVSPPEGNALLDRQQAVLFSLLHRLAAEGIELALPESRMQLTRSRPPSSPAVPTQPSPPAPEA